VRQVLIVPGTTGECFALHSYRHRIRRFHSPSLPDIARPPIKPDAPVLSEPHRLPCRSLYPAQPLLAKAPGLPYPDVSPTSSPRKIRSCWVEAVTDTRTTGLAGLGKLGEWRGIEDRDCARFIARWSRGIRPKGDVSLLPPLRVSPNGARMTGKKVLWAL